MTDQSSNIDTNENGCVCVRMSSIWTNSSIGILKFFWFFFFLIRLRKADWFLYCHIFFWFDSILRFDDIFVRIWLILVFRTILENLQFYHRHRWQIRLNVWIVLILECFCDFICSQCDQIFFPCPKIREK